MMRVAILLILSAFVVNAQTTRSVTITTKPKAKIWINDVYRGVTDDEGKLVIKNLPKKSFRIRVRAEGFQEVKKQLTASQNNIKVELVETTDKAELTFQKAENLAATNREKSLELYREVIRLKPKYAEAYVGMARVLMELGETDQALEAIAKARQIRPSYAEASAVEGRIYKDLGEEDKAIASFKRAIREGKGFQPEAYAGLGLLYKERAEGFSLEGRFDEEKANYELATNALKTSINQLAGAPDAEVLYQMLGLVYEKQQKYTEAIKVYEEFLRNFPDGNERTAVESFITPLKKKMLEEKQ